MTVPEPLFPVRLLRAYWENLNIFGAYEAVHERMWCILSDMLAGVCNAHEPRLVLWVLRPVHFLPLPSIYSNLSEDIQQLC